MMSTAPNSETAVSTSLSGTPGSVRSPANTAVSPSISPAACWATSPSMSLISTFAPSRTKSSAVARPMPRAEPVMIAALPSRSPMSSRSPLDFPTTSGEPLGARTLPQTGARERRVPARLRVPSSRDRSPQEGGHWRGGGRSGARDPGPGHACRERGAPRAHRHLGRPRGRREPLRRPLEGPRELLQRAAGRGAAPERPSDGRLPAARLPLLSRAPLPGALAAPRPRRRLRLVAQPGAGRPAPHRRRPAGDRRHARGRPRLVRQLVERRQARRSGLGALPPGPADPAHRAPPEDPPRAALARDRGALDGRRGRRLLRVAAPRLLRHRGLVLRGAVDPAARVAGRLQHPGRGLPRRVRRSAGPGVLLARPQPARARGQPPPHPPLRLGRRRGPRPDRPGRGPEHLRAGRGGGASRPGQPVRAGGAGCRRSRHVRPAPGHPRLALLARRPAARGLLGPLRAAPGPGAPVELRHGGDGGPDVGPALPLPPAARGVRAVPAPRPAALRERLRGGGDPHAGGLPASPHPAVPRAAAAGAGLPLAAFAPAPPRAAAPAWGPGRGEGGGRDPGGERDPGPGAAE